MKRKTNLFYVDGPDSKFLTFSNYTEALTGNFLSTDTKMFPDKFLCLKINNLNKTNKANFIKYLVRYYENKLAALRDNCITDNELEEHELLPLAYLLEAILNVCVAGNNGFTINNDLLLNPRKLDANEYINLFSNVRSNLITYIGSITEQDYNGTYTDIICNINANEYYEGKIVYNTIRKTSSNDYICYIDNSIKNNLYGWENETLFSDYENITPLYDIDDNINDTHYNYNSQLSYIEFVKQPLNNNINNYKTISFNVIIPLFSITNMNYKVNNTILEDEYNNDTIDNKKCIILNDNIIKTDNIKGRKDIPLGIWLYADKTLDTFINLERDNELNLYPSWSLLIGSQFKPFPYSLKYQKENDINKSSLQAYPTFAETLTKINDVLDNFNKINININKLDERITSIERQLKQIGTTSNISQLESKMLSLHSYVKDEINDFKKVLYGYVDNITWSSKYKNNN